MLYMAITSFFHYHHYVRPWAKYTVPADRDVQNAGKKPGPGDAQQKHVTVINISCSVPARSCQDKINVKKVF